MPGIDDENAILDGLMRREPFHEAAKRVMEENIFGDLEGYINVSGDRMN